MQKTKFLAVIFLSLTTHFLNAQNFYLRAGGGYTFQAAKTEFTNVDPYDLTRVITSQEVDINDEGVRYRTLKGSIGAGINSGLIAGYMFNKNIGTELGINYLYGDKILIARLSQPNTKRTTYTQLRGLDLSPAIFITPAFKGVNPYARIGLLFTISNDLILKSKGNTSPDGDFSASSEILTKVDNKLSTGYIAALGALLPIHDNISIFGEFIFRSIYIKNKQAEITSYNIAIRINDDISTESQLDNLFESARTIFFEDDYMLSGDESYDKPSVRPAQRMNASGAGINLGIRLSF